MTASLADVRASLARRFPDAMPLAYRTVVTVASGIEALDVMLPNGGFARGRLAVWAPGGGATAVLRSACANVVRRGERAAWIDGTGTLAEVWPEGSLLLRPGGESEALRCAEELLRSGGFALVGLSGGGAAALAREAVRLARAAKAGGSAFVVVGAEVPISALRLVSRLPPEGYCWWANPFGEPAEVESVRVEVRAWSLGWSGRTSFSLPVSARRPRLALDPLLPDRRGHALRARVSSSLALRAIGSELAPRSASHHPYADLDRLRRPRFRVAGSTPPSPVTHDSLTSTRNSQTRNPLA